MLDYEVFLQSSDGVWQCARLFKAENRRDAIKLRISLMEAPPTVPIAVRVNGPLDDQPDRRGMTDYFVCCKVDIVSYHINPIVSD